MTISPVHHISRCYIKPKFIVEESQKPYHLTPWDLAMLSAHYIQKGLLFPKPPPSNHPEQEEENPTITIINQLKESLSQTLVHFFPLSGRLVTEKKDNPPSYSIFLDCSNSPGAEFIHATADVTINDVLSPIDVHPIFNSFFAILEAVNHDGHTIPLLSVQVTELVDGIFVGCSLNHSVVDGTSYWHFFSAWSEMSRSILQGKSLSSIARPPILKRWYLEGHGPIMNLSFSHHNEFIDRYISPVLRERMFHFSHQSVARLKAKANAECNTKNISSFQALSALVWRSLTRARCIQAEQKTSCKMAINNRTRLNPPLSQDYFGNCIQTVSGSSTAGELLSHGLGWAAWLLHEAVGAHTDVNVREWLEELAKNSFVYQLSRFFEPCNVMMGSSPRFDMYGNDFGWGKAVAARSGFGNKFSGKASAYPGSEGGGSVDLEVCLPPDAMNLLESDDEFMNAVCYSP